MSRPKTGWEAQLCPLMQGRLWGEAARNMRCCRNALGSRGERLYLCWEMFARTVQAEKAERGWGRRWHRASITVPASLCQHRWLSTALCTCSSHSAPVHPARDKEGGALLAPEADWWCLPCTDFTVLVLFKSCSRFSFPPSEVISYNLGRVRLDGALSNLI